MRTDENLAAALAICRLRLSTLVDGGNDLPGDAHPADGLIPGLVVGDNSEERGLLQGRKDGVLKRRKLTLSKTAIGAVLDSSERMPPAARADLRDELVLHNANSRISKEDSLWNPTVESVDDPF